MHFRSRFTAAEIKSNDIYENNFVITLNPHFCGAWVYRQSDILPENGEDITAYFGIDSVLPLNFGKTHSSLPPHSTSVKPVLS